MTDTAFNPLRTPVDSILLGGLASPGVARVVGACARNKVDIRSAYGVSATVAVWAEIAEFSVEITLVTDDDWAQWHFWANACLKHAQRRPQRAAKFAQSIYHPFLAGLDIHSVIVKSVSQPEETDPTVYVVKIEFVEFRGLQTSSLAKPEAAKTTPTDPVEQLIALKAARLDAINQELAK